jgi:hypothetical protein
MYGVLPLFAVVDHCYFRSAVIICCVERGILDLGTRTLFRQSSSDIHNGDVTP